MTPVLDLRGISKTYGGLRPLRIERLTLSQGERVAILGFDRPMAEVFVNLVTGAALPDEGTVNVLGRQTADIADSSEWLALVDRLGIVSQRVVMLEGMTVVQNLALSFTLDIEPPSGEPLSQAQRLAREVELPEESWHVPVAELGGLSLASLRLARAIAHDPVLLLLEHVTSAIERGQVAEFNARLAAVAAGRATALVAMTADPAFAEGFSGRTLRLDPATGKLSDARIRGWFGRRFG